MSGRGNLRKVAWAPPPARKGSDAIPPRLNPRWNSLRAQNKKKEERALEIKTEKETDVKGRRTTSPHRTLQ